MRRAILILADGARPDVLANQFAQGRLPNLQKYFVQQGDFRTITTVFPSTTGPAYLPYLTGQFPGPCNVPGIRWFDKPRYAEKGWGFGSFRSYVGLESYCFNDDVAPHIKTLWDEFPKSFNIFNVITRGLSNRRDLTHYRRVWDFFKGHQTDRWDKMDDQAGAYLLNIVETQDFQFTFCMFPGVDEYSHRTSPFSPEVLASYERLDRWMGRLFESLQKRGIADDTLVTIVSDHGLSETHTHFDIGPWLEKEKKIRTFYYTNIFKFKFDAVSMVSGNGMTNLYFKGEKGWADRVSFEELTFKSILLDELRFRPEIDVVAAYGADHAIHILTERGHSYFYVDPTTLRVKFVVDRHDALGIFEKNDVRLQNGFTMDEFHDLSMATHYPDIVMQLHQVFQSPRTGDVIVTAKSGFDLREKFEHPLHVASHGSFCPEHMKIPFLSSLPQSTVKRRSVEVYDLIRQHLLG